MMIVLGVVLFALGILISVSLHEAGHMATAKAFGMKVTRFFVGFGPTLWSFRKGETEYGVKAIPAGGFVKIVGMTPQDDDVDPADEPRAMWRFPVWKRTIVMAAGSATHFILGAAILWGLFAFVPLPDAEKLNEQAPQIATVATCVKATWEYDPATGRDKSCVEGVDPQSPAASMGLRPGDVITAIDGRPVRGWSDLTDRVRAAGGETIQVTYERDGVAETRSVTLPLVQRIKRSVDPNRTLESITDADLERVGLLGISPVVPESTAGPIAAVGLAADQTVFMFENTLKAIKKFPEKVPKLWAALTGEERDPETPISIVGASVIGGQLFERGMYAEILLLLAMLNFFVGIFNMLPLLPLDGGHIAIAWFERARSWCYARLGKADPGRVDYYKLMPLTYMVIFIFGGFALLTLATDIVNPITLPF
ncbi:MAG TPA: site-2 protease family protein [Micromonosporaceae bacterium]